MLLQKIQKKIIWLFNQNILMSLILIGIGSYVCTITKFEIIWDFANYHYYNAYAFLNNRLNYDIAPASVNTFFNPLIELPLYFLIQKFNQNIDVIYAFQGIWFGLLLFVFYKIVRLFFDQDSLKDIGLSLLCVLIAATGQATFFQAGTSSNEVTIAFLAFSSLYIIFKMIKAKDEQSRRKFFIAGIILGGALGLKGTIIYQCLAVGLSLIFCFKFLKRPLLFILLFALGGLVGYLLTNGWWMYKLWVLYDNPFFPFLNKIFNSPYYDYENFSDKRFMLNFPMNLIHPFIWNYGPHTVAEIIFSDVHSTIYYFLLLTSFIYLLFKPQKIIECYKNNQLYFFFCVWGITAYILWLNIFSIYRYVIVIEMAGAIFFIKSVFNYKSRFFVLEGIYYAMVVFTCYVMVINYEGYSWSRKTITEKKYVDIEDITLPPNTLVKLYNFPTAALIPELAKNNTFRALGYYHYNAGYMKGSDFSDRGKFKQIKDKIVAQHKGPIVIIYRDLYWGENGKNFQKILKKDTQGMYCRELENNLKQEWYICIDKKLKKYIAPKKTKN